MCHMMNWCVIWLNWCVIWFLLIDVSYDSSSCGVGLIQRVPWLDLFTTWVPSLDLTWVSSLDLFIRPFAKAKRRCAPIMARTSMHHAQVWREFIACTCVMWLLHICDMTPWNVIVRSNEHGRGKYNLCRLDIWMIFWNYCATMEEGSRKMK